MLQLLLQLSIFTLKYLVEAKTCKAVPHSLGWPSKVQWNALDTSLSGQLLEPLPPAAVCDASLSVYNNVSCSYDTSQRTMCDFHAREPVSVDQSIRENDPCVPGPATHYSLARFSPYLANMTTGTEVRLWWTLRRNQKCRVDSQRNWAWLSSKVATSHTVITAIRLTIIGRSIAPDSESIWTHNLRGLQWHDAFILNGCAVDGSPTITAAAGHRISEIYDAAAADG